ncbi:hypothetical protein [Xylophilus sp. Leaf220]|uniref:hypothetical protein n=1 Tax=Xylophilus sp. Leaf220 TaxID=1735686 RepID=UPI0006FF3B91|nr:hypothetical protein [Xylophilus sp. Leaf220]KQM75655.1 hypothetical protein ASE76_06995 [Xylophilus sp. Leaf220]
MATSKPFFGKLDPIGKKLGDVVLDRQKIPHEIKLLPPDLDKWLTKNPTVSGSIVWERPDTALAKHGPAAWKDWNTGERQLLKDAFAKAWYGTLSADPTPYPNTFVPPPGEHPTTVLTQAVALQHYMESVATCLVSDMRLPPAFGLSQRTEEERAWLLDSRSLFEWVNAVGSGGQKLIGYMVNAWVLPSRPGYMRQALDTFSLLRSTHLDTVVEMVRFCGTLFHFGGAPGADEYENHWHYRGYMPVSRCIEGTIPTPSPDHPYQETTVKRWTAGCAGTVGLMSHLLRMANVPVIKGYACDHALPHFSSIGRWLSHGDDPYPLKYHPEIDPAQLLIDEATHQAWFGPEADACGNIGRRAKEVFG